MEEITVYSQSRAAHTCFRTAITCQSLAFQASKEFEVKHHCKTGIIFVAFSIEAMINHFGQVMFKDEWERERKCRKEQHKMLFKAVNLPDYLGTRTYQLAKQCFEIRDNFAHGKTKDETLKVEISQNTSFEERVEKVVSEPTLMENVATIENLKKYIEIVQQIQDDIEDNGYYPDQEDIPEEERQKLSERPLIMGVKEF